MLSLAVTTPMSVTALSLLCQKLTIPSKLNPRLVLAFFLFRDGTRLFWNPLAQVSFGFFLDLDSGSVNDFRVKYRHGK